MYCLLTKYQPFNNIASDAEFILNATGSIALHHEESFIFNPFPNDENKFILNDKDLDPDINYWNNITLPDCNYVTSSDLNALCSEYKDYNQFSIMHSNCRSIVKNYSLLFLVNLLNHHISVIAVSELWTNKDNEHFFNIPGFNFVAKSRLHTVV